MRKTHPASIKLKVALAAIAGQPVVDICQQFEVAQSLVHKWKKQLKENGVVVFQDANSKSNNDCENIDKLHQVIGRLTTELEFLKKVLRA
jgi:transposase-like protein